MLNNDYKFVQYLKGNIFKITHMEKLRISLINPLVVSCLPCTTQKKD